jgi:hypothetical protein
VLLNNWEKEFKIDQQHSLHQEILNEISAQMLYSHSADETGYLFVLGFSLCVYIALILVLILVGVKAK